MIMMVMMVMMVMVMMMVMMLMMMIMSRCKKEMQQDRLSRCNHGCSAARESGCNIIVVTVYV